MRHIALLALCLLMASSAMAQTTENLEIMGDHGKLSAVLHLPKMEKGKKVHMVMLIHGFTGYKDERIHTMAAEKLQKLGYACIRFDFNGHGKSEGDFQRMTIPNEVVDAKKVYEYVAKLPYVKDISIAGHSQGGVVTSLIAGELGTKAFRRVVLMAPASMIRDNVLLGRCMGGVFDLDNPPEYIEMKNGLRLGREYMTSLYDLNIYKIAAGYQGPVCLIHGTRDEAVPMSTSETYQMIYKHNEIHYLDGFDHHYSQDLEKAVDLEVEFLTRK